MLIIPWWLMLKLKLDITAVLSDGFRHLHSMETPATLKPDLVMQGLAWLPGVDFDQYKVARWLTRHLKSVEDTDVYAEAIYLAINEAGERIGTFLIDRAETSTLDGPVVVQWRLDDYAPTAPVEMRAAPEPVVEDFQVLLDPTFVEYEHGRIGASRFTIAIPGEDYSRVLYLIGLKRKGKMRLRLANTKSWSMTLAKLECPPELRERLKELADSGVDEDSQHYAFSTVLSYCKLGTTETRDAYYLRPADVGEDGVSWHWIMCGTGIFECRGDEIRRK